MKDRLRDIPFFAFCADEDLDKMLSVSHKSVYRTGERIVSREDACRSLMLLTSGSVKIKGGVEGQEATVISAPFPIAPELLFASRGRYPFDIVAGEPSEIWHVDREGFFGFMQTHPSVLRIFLQTVSDRSFYIGSKK